MSDPTTRRRFNTLAGTAVVAAPFLAASSQGATASQGSPSSQNSLSGSSLTQTHPETLSAMSDPNPHYCLNTSTIHGEKIEVRDQVKIAAKAGYDGIELWMRDVQRFQESGGKLRDLASLIKDSNLRVESAIAFAPWIVNDETTRIKALDQAAKDMQILKELGGTRIAAPPAGATDGDRLDLDRVAERYRALLEVGDREGILPQLEVWGFSKNLSRLCEVLYVTSAADHPSACVLPDVYHLYKGGSNFHDLRMISGRVVHVFHMNDYPAAPARDKISDADRIYPLEGIAPVTQVLKTMIQAGFQGVLSLELFNRTYWEQDPQSVANTGLAKMKTAWQRALA